MIGFDSAAILYDLNRERFSLCLYVDSPEDYILDHNLDIKSRTADLVCSLVLVKTTAAIGRSKAIVHTS